MNLSRLSDDELFCQAYAGLDDLTSSDLERELLRRFEELMGLRPLVGLMGQYDIETPDQLCAALELAQDCRNLADDAPDLNHRDFTERLDALLNQAQTQE